jgi:hypothetical protein
MGSTAPQEVFPPEFEEMWGSPLARLAVRRGRRLRQSVRRRPLLLDAVLALLLLTAGLVAPRQSGSGQAAVEAPTALLVLTVLGQSLPLVWRRRAPLAALAVVLAACVVQWGWWGESQRSVGGLLIAIYSLARYERLNRLFWPAPFLVAGLAVSAYRVKPFEQQPLYSLFFLCATSVAAATLALVVRARRHNSVRWPTGLIGWRWNASSAYSWRPSPNAPASPARCTTSSATTWPSSSASPTGRAMRPPTIPPAEPRCCPSSPAPPGRR